MEANNQQHTPEPSDQVRPREIQMSPALIPENGPADAHHNLKSFLSIIFVTFFLLGGFLAAFLLKEYLQY